MSLSPEIRVFLERAAARRSLLEAFLDVMPRNGWEHQAEGEAWNARVHLAHLATIDEPTAALFAEAAAGSQTVRPMGAATSEALAAARERLLEPLLDARPADLRRRLRDSREAALAALAALDGPALDAAVLLPPAPSAWSPPPPLPLRAYIAAWIEHDGEHLAAIRRAVTSPPGPGALATAARLRRR